MADRGEEHDAGPAWAGAGSPAGGNARQGDSSAEGGRESAKLKLASLTNACQNAFLCLWLEHPASFSSANNKSKYL